MRPNVWVALAVGAVLGFAAGRVVSPDGGSREAVRAERPVAAASAPRRPADITVYRVPLEGSHSEGREDALVTLVAFTDYQCPYCARAESTLAQLRETYGEHLRLVVKHNPLPNHPQARPAALAALAAGAQGRFQEMHRLLFGNPRGLDEAGLEQHAQQLGLDMERWRRDRAHRRHEERIRTDQALAQQLGVTGTPAFFINGRLLYGAKPLEEFKALIDEELEKARALVRSGVPANAVYARLTANGREGPRASP
ncbi:MAG: thioredoxin domain-containing protein [Myxococcaceae bacterium]|nr:thioredoxin domain-containing protein [Myxococcaceae bacterium]MCI0671063.1 thioredoxin domain-containing protein [Myxococcaceae bacterium]